MMRLNPNNLRIMFLVLRYWLDSIYHVTVLHPSSYLSKITAEVKGEEMIDLEKWTMVKKVVKGVNRISPMFAKKRKCLMEALIVYKTLSKFEITSHFKLGAKKTKRQLVTHAWVEINGKTVVGGAVSGYSQLIRTR